MEPTVLIVAGLGLAAAALRTPLLALARACPALGYIGGGSCTTFVWWRSEGDALLCAVVLGMALGFSVAIARQAFRRGANTTYAYGANLAREIMGQSGAGFLPSDEASVRAARASSD
jgi:hypothetical protein